MPLDPQWLLDSPAYASENPKLVRACLAVLMRAWESTPAGSVSSNFKSLSNITGLSEPEVVDNFDELFLGWVLHDGRMYFPAMNALCERISLRFHDVIQTLSDQAAAVIQDPEEFTLAPSEVTSKAKGKHRLPKHWQVSEVLRVWAGQHGFVTAEDVDFIEEKFISHYRSKGDMLIDWDAAFRNFALKENTSRLPSQRNQQAGFVRSDLSRAARFGSAGAGTSALVHNTSALQAAAERSMRHST